MSETYSKSVPVHIFKPLMMFVTQWPIIKIIMEASVFTHWCTYNLILKSRTLLMMWRQVLICCKLFFLVDIFRHNFFISIKLLNKHAFTVFIIDTECTNVLIYGTVSLPCGSVRSENIYIFCYYIKLGSYLFFWFFFLFILKHKNIININQITNMFQCNSCVT